MSDKFSLEIINPEASFLIDENVNEVILPAIEGEMGIADKEAMIKLFTTKEKRIEIKTLSGLLQMP